jgi:hypothetical protein
VSWQQSRQSDRSLFMQDVGISRLNATLNLSLSNSGATKGLGHRGPVPWNRGSDIPRSLEAILSQWEGMTSHRDLLRDISLFSVPIGIHFSLLASHQSVGKHLLRKGNRCYKYMAFLSSFDCPSTASLEPAFNHGSLISQQN